MLFALRQVLNLQWLQAEGYRIRVTDMGAIMYQDEDFEIEDKDEKELDVTELFMLSGDTPTTLGDRLSDFMLERYCPPCKGYHDPTEIQEIDSDYSDSMHNQICGDCRIDLEESMTDPYTLRGLSRSDFY